MCVADVILLAYQLSKNLMRGPWRYPRYKSSKSSFTSMQAAPEGVPAKRADSPGRREVLGGGRLLELIGLEIRRHWQLGGLRGRAILWADRPVRRTVLDGRYDYRTIAWRSFSACSPLVLGMGGAG